MINRLETEVNPVGGVVGAPDGRQDHSPVVEAGSMSRRKALLVMAGLGVAGVASSLEGDGKGDGHIAMGILGAAVAAAPVDEHEDHAHAEHLDPHELMKHQAGVLAQIRDAGGMQKYVDSLPSSEIARIFYTSEQLSSLPRAVGCIDEGVQDDECPPGYVVLHSAGSGILKIGAEPGFDPLDPEYVASVAQKLVDNNVTLLTSHGSGCGAAAEAERIVERMTPMQVAAMSPAQRKAFNQRAATRNAKFLEAVRTKMDELKAGMGMEIEHVETIHRPTTHNATAAFVDTTGGRLRGSRQIDATGKDWKGSAKMPVAFTISGHVTGAETAATAGLAFSIAKGDHGLGKEFTPKQPFRIVVWGFNGGKKSTVGDDIRRYIQTNVATEDQSRVVVEEVFVDDPDLHRQ